MIRKIVDYQKLNQDILNLLVEKFPDGYGDRDIISFRNAHNDLIEAVEVKTKDTVYLVKVGTHVAKAMLDFGDDSITNTETTSPESETGFNNLD